MCCFKVVAKRTRPADAECTTSSKKNNHPALELKLASFEQRFNILALIYRLLAKLTYLIITQDALCHRCLVSLHNRAREKIYQQTIQENNTINNTPYFGGVLFWQLFHKNVADGFNLAIWCTRALL